MLLEKLDPQYKDYYQKMLETIGSLSRLFSESNSPYLASRVTENLYCKSFEAENLGRSDVSADAEKDRVGIGIKTFLEGNGKTLQKIAEFNKEHKQFIEEDLEDRIKIVSEFRNDRINVTKRLHGLDDMIYHCVVRRPSRIRVYEILMDTVQIENISNIQSSDGKIITFEDGLNEYSFNTSKSTLYKRFITPEVLLDVPVKIIEDPFVALEQLMQKVGSDLTFATIRKGEKVFLPLYSTRGEKHVAEKSGLNQWNAAGRPRNPNEIYIPIPAWIHDVFTDFFPPRDQHFNLHLPDGKQFEAKVCQDNKKALMTKHNADLGQWLLRDVLGLEERELLTYEKLERIGMDSVVIYKNDDSNFEINFARIGSYEFFHKSKTGEETTPEDYNQDE